jgi:hypothetical protein
MIRFKGRGRTCVIATVRQQQTTFINPNCNCSPTATAPVDGPLGEAPSSLSGFSCAAAAAAAAALLRAATELARLGKAMMPPVGNNTTRLHVPVRAAGGPDPVPSGSKRKQQQSPGLCADGPGEVRGVLPPDGPPEPERQRGRRVLLVSGWEDDDDERGWSKELVGRRAWDACLI